MEVRELRARSWQLGKISVHRQRPYATKYGTHDGDVSRIDGVVLLFGVVKHPAQANVAELCHSLAMAGE